MIHLKEILLLWPNISLLAEHLSLHHLFKHLPINQKFKRKAFLNYMIKILSLSKILFPQTFPKQTPEHLPSRLFSTYTPLRFTDCYWHKLTWSICQQLATTTTQELFKPLIAPSLVTDGAIRDDVMTLIWNVLRDIYRHERYQSNSPLRYWQTIITLLTTVFSLKQKPQLNLIVFFHE